MFKYVYRTQTKSVLNVSATQAQVSTTASAAGESNPVPGPPPPPAAAPGGVARPVSRGRVRRVGPQRPEQADVRRGADRDAGSGERRVGRGPGDQRRGRVDKSERGVRGHVLRSVVRDRLVSGR